MKGRRYFVIFNPNAGKGKYKDKVERIKNEFKSRSIPFDLFFTDLNKNTTQLVQERFYPGSYSDILILGGDGTINQTANGLGPGQTPISVISMGTGNDTIKHIHKDLAFDYQLKTAFDGNPVAVDAGSCNGELFLNGVGIGFDGKVVELMAREGEKYARYSSYMRTVLRLIATYREKDIDVELDDRSINSPVFLMSIAKGTTFGGGFLLNPYANNNDGFLDICVINKIPVWKRAYYLPQMKFGGHRKLKVVNFFKSERVTIKENQQLVAHMDGEFIGHPPFVITAKKSAFRFRN